MNQQNEVLCLPKAALRTGLIPFVFMIFLLAVRGETPAHITERGGTADAPLTARMGNVSIYRVRADYQRGRYWVLGDDHVQVYSATDKRLIAKITIPGWNVAGGVGLPDLVLDRAGGALVSSNAVSLLWYIHPEKFSIMRKEIALQGRENWSTGFSGLVFTPDETLFGVTAFGGTLWKIDVRAGNATPIALSRPLLDARELGLRLERTTDSTLFDTLLCVRTGTEFLEVRLDANKNTAIARLHPNGCK